MLCSRCKNEAIIHLKYNGDFLCRNCFIDFFESRIRKTIRKKNMIDVGDRICVGLSGGKDSSSLLYFLKNFSEKRKTEILAITIDIGINSEYGKETLENAKKVCQKLGVEHYIYSFKDEIGTSMDEIYSKIKNSNKNKITGLCTYCGVLKRNLLNKKAKELKCNKLAIAHNLDDEGQTFLMNIVRGDIERIIWGSGLIKDEKMVPRIKPFMKSPEDEIRLYAKINFPELNFDHICPYRKDAYRKTFKEILNLLEEKHPGSRFQILKSNEKIRERLLKDYIIEEPNHCKICGNVCNGEICKTCKILENIKKR